MGGKLTYMSNNFTPNAISTESDGARVIRTVCHPPRHGVFIAWISSPVYKEEH